MQQSRLQKCKRLFLCTKKECEIIGKYNVIYADPPWRYGQKGLQGAAEKHYPTMSIDELCALPVADLAAPDSVLFMWATFPQLPEALRLIRAWGFTYKSVGFVWLKKNRKADSWFYGLGFWTRGNAEVCLLATKGHPKRKSAHIHQFSKAYLAEHEEELDRYRAAKATMFELLAGAKLPKMAELKKSRQELAARKKELYPAYRAAQRDMRELVAVKGNIDHLLNVTGGRENKEQER